MILKLSSIFLCFQILHTSCAKRDNEEGYNLQQPPVVPHEIFPNRNIPRVPVVQDPESYYNTQEVFSGPDDVYGSPRQPDEFQQIDRNRPLRPLPVQPFEPVHPELPQTYPLQLGEIFTQEPQIVPFTDDDQSPRRGQKLFPNALNGQKDTTTASSMVGMPYDFQWEVRDEENNNMYNHIETSDGSVTTGEYRVLLPDGRLQIVKFADRGRGYEAVVTYEDHPNLIF